MNTTFTTLVRRFLPRCILLLTAATAFADSATTVFCFFPGTALTTDPNSCQISGPPDLSGFSGVNASSQVSFSLAGNATDFTDLHFTQSAIARAPLGAPYYGPLPIAISSASLTGVTLTTAGPDRAGLIQVLYTPMVTVTSDGINGNYSVSLPGVPTVGCNLTGVTSADACQQYVQNFQNHLFSFDLGTQFDFNLAGVLTAYGNSDNSNASGYADVDYRFRFFEADGLTPVAVQLVTPEPASWTLLVVGVLLIIFGRCRPTTPKL
jgi:hypothetical protein